MKGAVIILVVTVIMGIVLYLLDLPHRGRREEIAYSEENGDCGSEEKREGGEQNKEPEVCCGMHEVCEKTTLMPLSGDIVYYDDEELDRFKERNGGDYTPEETEEFRDVLLTLLPEDVAGWSKSLQLRNIVLPADVKEELIMIVSEQRAKP